METYKRFQSRIKGDVETYIKIVIIYSTMKLGAAYFSLVEEVRMDKSRCHFSEVLCVKDFLQLHPKSLFVTAAVHYRACSVRQFPSLRFRKALFPNDCLASAAGTHIRGRI